MSFSFESADCCRLFWETYLTLFTFFGNSSIYWDLTVLFLVWDNVLVASSFGLGAIETVFWDCYFFIDSYYLFWGDWSTICISFYGSSIFCFKVGIFGVSFCYLSLGYSVWATGAYSFYWSSSVLDCLSLSFWSLGLISSFTSGFSSPFCDCFSEAAACCFSLTWVLYSAGLASFCYFTCCYFSIP